LVVPILSTIPVVRPLTLSGSKEDANKIATKRKIFVLA